MDRIPRQDVTRHGQYKDQDKPLGNPQATANFQSTVRSIQQRPQIRLGISNPFHTKQTKMRPTLFVPSLLSLLRPISAIITGFAVPATIAPGSSFDLVITTANYIQRVQDVSISFGLAFGTNAAPNFLGTSPLGSRFIGPGKHRQIPQHPQFTPTSPPPDNSNVLYNLTYPVIVPEDAPQGIASINGALFSLYGASFGSPVVSLFVANVSVGEATDLGSYEHSSPLQD